MKGAGMAELMNNNLNQNLTGQNPWERRQEIGIPAALLETVREVLLRPSQFFKNMTISQSIAEPFLFYLILAWPLQFIGLAFQNIFHLQESIKLPLFGELLFIFIGTPIMFYIGVAVAHLFVMMFRGRGGFKGTFNVFAYSSATGLLGIVPVLGPIVGGIWGIVIVIIGYKRVHGFSTARAVFAYFGIIFIIMLMVMAAIAVPVFLRAKISAQNALATAKLKTMSAALETYASAHGGQYPTSDLELNPSYLLQSYCDKEDAGYSYHCQLETGGYTIIATPLKPGTTGSQSITVTTGGRLSDPQTRQSSDSDSRTTSLRRTRRFEPGRV